MPIVRLKGLNSKTKVLADGSRVTYWWAWKGGPRLPGKPGSPEFMAAYNAAVASQKTVSTETLAGLVARFKASPEFLGNAETTKAEWRRWLDKIAADRTDLDIGGLPLSALDDRRVRADILAWRDQWADRPRSADYAMQVLGRVLSWSVSRGLLAQNAAAGVEQLYSSNRADQVWSADEVDRFCKAAASPEVGFIIRLACLTGLRRADLIRLSWHHVGDVAIVMPTGKSRGRKTQVIPLLSETNILLAEIKTRQRARHAELAKVRAAKRMLPPTMPTTVLSNTRGAPWSDDGVGHQFIETKQKCDPVIDKHLHDCRGTFGTRLRLAGLAASEIADILGWEEKRVERLLATYVDRQRVVQELAERIRRNEARS